MTVYSQPEATFEASLEGAPSGLVGTLGVQVINPPAGTVMTARTTAGIVEQPAGSGIYHTVLTAPAGLDTYSVIWDTGSATPSYASEDLVVSGFAFPTSTFATVADVQAKCGTDFEDAQVEYMLDAATAVILEAAGKDLDWLADPESTIPVSLRYIAVELTCRALHNPSGTTATREQLGEYSISQSYASGYEGGGLWLTRLERMLIRKAVYGTLSGSSRPDSLLTTFFSEPAT